MMLILFGLGLLAVIGFAMIFVGVAVMASLVIAISVLSFSILEAILGDQNTGLSLILAIPIGIIGAILILNRGEKK